MWCHVHCSRNLLSTSYGKSWVPNDERKYKENVVKGSSLLNYVLVHYELQIRWRLQHFHTVKVCGRWCHLSLRNYVPWHYNNDQINYLRTSQQIFVIKKHLSIFSHKNVTALSLMMAQMDPECIILSKISQRITSIRFSESYIESKIMQRPKLRDRTNWWWVGEIY